MPASPRSTSTPLSSSRTAALACWTGESGDAAGARDQYAALLPVLEQVFGAEHPGTMGARTELARWTQEVGESGQAT
jgi:hypothetical protein